MLNKIPNLIREIAENCNKNNHVLTTAESCTGGLIAKSLTDIAGSSAWFDCGFVVYSNSAKSRMLGIDRELIETYGAVSEGVVEAMCLGALKYSQADLVVAVSGVAGPGGGTTEKPVGTVWVGWSSKKSGPFSFKYLFPGGREAIRQQTLEVALQKFAEMSASK